MAGLKFETMFFTANLFAELTEMEDLYEIS